jgi:hypothetical protein
VTEGVDVLAERTPTLAEALTAAGEQRRLLLDGTLTPTWRCGAQATDANPDPLYNAKHREHGINIQTLTDTTGELVFLDEARPGSTHDVTAARADGIVAAVTNADVETTGDSGYQGAGGAVRTPVKRPKGKGHNRWEKLANTALARLRAPVERAFAALKRRRVLDTVRISHRTPARDLRHPPETIFTPSEVDRKLLNGQPTGARNRSSWTCRLLAF